MRSLERLDPWQSSARSRALRKSSQAEGGRLKKRAAIAQAIAEVADESLADAGLFALYLAGTPFAEADTRKLNAGGALLTRALLAVSGATDAELGTAYRRHGDLGAAAFDLLQKDVPEGAQPANDGPTSDAPLTLAEVSVAFDGMATAKTTAIRASLVEGLLRRSSALEAKYLLKLMLGDMRIGVKQSLVEEAIAIAAASKADLRRQRQRPTRDIGGGRSPRRHARGRPRRRSPPRL